MEKERICLRSKTYTSGGSHLMGNGGRSLTRQVTYNLPILSLHTFYLPRQKEELKGTAVKAWKKSNKIKKFRCSSCKWRAYATQIWVNLFLSVPIFLFTGREDGSFVSVPWNQSWKSQLLSQIDLFIPKLRQLCLQSTTKTTELTFGGGYRFPKQTKKRVLMTASDSNKGQ